jgi:hypothetical protein
MVNLNTLRKIRLPEQLAILITLAANDPEELIGVIPGNLC